ncbi:LacI family transcriptional regulator [Frondihabitans sucicola]|uniref:LacI family transcriptional regulator n=1 Tax=Frondihabitans sucicola TaxID=1268041 RepID=A0ABM8GU40_9MICO|nr:LacI family DNA-binding transcriptional regulator [Frondihabitans sucicola]BDZ51958.1 LacI family transcriptional regulator [Frondihabitans sucicola]
MPATMHDVAALARVSVKTVSNYFNGYPYMRAETRARIERAVDELGYRLNVTARSLRRGSTGMISLIVPELDQAYFAELAQEVIDVAATFGLTVLVETTSGDRDRELEALSGLHRQLIDGAIFDPLALGPSDAPQLGGGLPLVILGERQFEGLADHVLIADEEVAHRAVSHLVEIGRRRILLLGAGSPGTHTAILRRRGSEAALAEAGLPVDGDLVVSTDGWTRDAGAAATARALDDGRRFDAVFGFNDALALGAQWVLLERGLAVPGDVAVIGVDDTRDARFAHPTLTTMSPGRAQIARRAVELLVSRIREPETENGFASVTADFELIVRDSTVAPGTLNSTP